jgi:hypothetical protein
MGAPGDEPDADLFTIGAPSGDAQLAKLMDRVADAIRDSDHDFRTGPSLMAELGVSREDLDRALGRLIESGAIRRPIVSGYPDWYRSDPRPTRREKLIRLLALIGREPV